MTSDSDSKTKTGLPEKPLASRKKKKVEDESEDSDDESENTEAFRERKKLEKKKKAEKALRKAAKEAKEAKKSIVNDDDSDEISVTQHIIPEVITHHSNMMVRQDIDDLESDSEDEEIVKPTEKVQKIVDKISYKQDDIADNKSKTKIQSDEQVQKQDKRVASRQDDTDSLSENSQVLKYKKKL
jgi:hypothetical protein